MNPETLRKFLWGLPDRPIVVMSHERSGTHLNIDLLRKQMKECGVWKWPGQKLSRLYLSVESLDNPGAPTPTPSTTAAGVLRRGGVPVFKTHLTYAQLRDGGELYGRAVPEVWREWLLERGRFCYVYRDGRAVMSSLYLFRDYDPVLARLDWSAFLRHAHEGGTPPLRWAQHVRQGLGIPEVYPMRWESVVSDTRKFLEETAARFDLTPRYAEPLLPRRRTSSQWSSIWGRLALTHESTAIVHTKPSPKWRELFTPEDGRYFESETAGLIRELGYDPDPAWYKKLD